MDYSMILNGGTGIGGYGQASPGAANRWMSYLSVDDVDAEFDAALRAGATQRMAPIDFGPVGRGATIADPTGAVLSLWKSASDDAPDKIIAFYDKELQKYGKTIQCHGAWSGGHVESSHGKDEGSKPVSCGNDGHGDSVKLKVGTEGNQHIVAVKPASQGTRFALVYVRMHTGSDSTI